MTSSIDFFQEAGKVAIGSRLRMLVDKITENSVDIYKLYGVDFKLKWFPVFFVLTDNEPKTVTAIASIIGQTHPSVSYVIKEMLIAGVIDELKDDPDKRRNIVRLTPKGQQMAEVLKDHYMDVNAAIDNITKQAENDLWEAIEEWENLLSEKSLLQRIEEEKKKRECKNNINNKLINK